MLVSVEFVCKYDAELHRHQSDPNSFCNRVNSASPGKRSGICEILREGKGESICYSATKLGRVRFEHRPRQRGQRYQAQQCDLRISKRGRDRCTYKVMLNSALCSSIEGSSKYFPIIGILYVNWTGFFYSGIYHSLHYYWTRFFFFRNISLFTLSTHYIITLYIILHYLCIR